MDFHQFSIAMANTNNIEPFPNKYMAGCLLGMLGSSLLQNEIDFHFSYLGRRILASPGFPMRFVTWKYASVHHQVLDA